MTISLISYYGNGLTYYGDDALRVVSNARGTEMDEKSVMSVIRAHSARVGRANTRVQGNKVIFTYNATMYHKFFVVLVLNP